MKRERKIHESFGTDGRHLIKVYTKEEYFTDGEPMSYTDKPLSPRRLKVIEDNRCVNTHLH